MFRKLTFPIANERGEKLVAVRECFNPLAFDVERAQVSLVRARHQSGIVLVQNAQRGSWELPGGFIDPGENASDCAMRELYEESGLLATRVTPLGLIKIECPNAPLLHCVLYECHVDGIPCPRDAEIANIAFWNVESELEPISGIDAALLNWPDLGRHLD